MVTQVQLLGQLPGGRPLQRGARHDHRGQVILAQPGGLHERPALRGAGVEPEVDERLPSRVGPQRQRRGRHRVADDLHSLGGGAAPQQLPAGDQRLEDDVGQLNVVRHQLSQPLGRDPVDRPGLPDPGPHVDVLPGQEAQLAHETARADLGHGLGRHRGGRRPDDLDGAFGDHDQVDVLITRLEQHIAFAGLLSRAVAGKSFEERMAQARRRGHPGQRAAWAAGRIGASQRDHARRRHPGRRVSQAGSAKCRAAVGGRGSSGGGGFIHQAGSCGRTRDQKDRPAFRQRRSGRLPPRRSRLRSLDCRYPGLDSLHGG